jgi:hypothetical protein
MPTDDLNGLPDVLRRLRPSRAALDRDALMFGAGRASAPRVWPWRVAAGVAVVFACAFALAFVSVATRAPTPAVVPPAPHARQADAVGEADQPAALPGGAPDEAGPPQPASPWSAALPAMPEGQSDRLRDHLLQWGLDGLGPPPPTPPGRRSLDDLLRSF